MHMSLGGRQLDAAAARFNVRRTTDIAQVDAAATGRHLHLPGALPNFHAAAAGFNVRFLRARVDCDASAAGLGHDLAVGMANRDGPPPVCSPRSPFTVPTSIEPPPVSALTLRQCHRTGCFRRRSRLPRARRRQWRRHCRPQFQASPAPFRGEPSDGNSPEKCRGVSSALPVSHDPRSVALHVRGYFVLLKLAASFLLRRGSKTCMNDIINALLLPATHYHRTHIDFHSQVLDRSQRSCDLPVPRSRLRGIPAFPAPGLRRSQRRKQAQHPGQPDDL